MGILFLVNHAAAVPGCLAIAGADDTVLLIEDGVYAAVGIADQDCDICALRADIEQRGLAVLLPSRVRIVDDAEFAELVVNHQPIVTWR